VMQNVCGPAPAKAKHFAAGKRFARTSTPASP
jgi:hypothetical protein